MNFSQNVMIKEDHFMVLISLSIDFQIMLNASRHLETLVSGMPAVRSSACNNPTISGATHYKGNLPNSTRNTMASFSKVLG